MAVQHWLTRYHTGNDTIDRLHEELFDLMDGVYGDILAKAGPVLVAGKVRKLGQLTLTHFLEEEAEMKAAGYAALAAHAASHGAIRDQLQSLIAAADRGQAVGTEALEVMGQYLTQHIKQFDLAWAKASAKK